MTAGERLELMHAVLDGAASEAEKRGLEALLAADPVAKAEFAALQRLFEHLGKVPKLEPSRELDLRDAYKLFGPSRVLGLSSATNFWGGWMNKRLIWSGIAVAGVAVVVAGNYFFNIPSTGENLTGTITPAQRYRAPEQIKSSDVKLGDQTIAQLMQSDVVIKAVKDPQFQALAANPQAFQALAANAQAFAAMASSPQAFQAMAANPQAFQALAANPQAFQAMAANPQAFAAFANDPKAFAAAAANPQAFQAMAANAQAFQALAANAQAMQALQANPQAFQAMAA
ncbi:MAG TPA: hypothetical protein VIV54_13645, partial [Burkholderiales bacterium]